MSDFSTVLWAVILGSVGAFVALELVVWSWAWRHPPVMVPLESGAAKPVHWRGLQAAWLATPAVILVCLVAWSQRVLGSDVGLAGEPDLVVHVTGKQFVWEIRHQIPGETGERDTLNQLHVPVGATVEVQLESADVVHGFWVPQLRIRKDVAPGKPETIRFRPLEEGEFNIVCAELCGNSHYSMRGFVHVQSPEKFAAWVRETGSAAK